MRYSLFKFLFLIGILMLNEASLAQTDVGELELVDPEDIELLNEEFPETKTDNAQVSSSPSETPDDLEQLKKDLGELNLSTMELDEIESGSDSLEESVGEEGGSFRPEIVTENAQASQALIFEVGRAEKDLLAKASKMMGKIPYKEWNEIRSTSETNSYTVQKGDWLWKISKRIFGSGFYYSKIWALNPYITNPHLIEPGMVLTFDMGTQDAPPTVTVGASDSAAQSDPSKDSDFEKWGTGAKPDWVEERKKLQEQGVFFQYSSSKTRQDLDQASKTALNTEYQGYEPPRPDFFVEIPTDQYDETGFDRSSVVSRTFKQGFHVNTFLSTNIVQDLGKVDSAIDDKEIFSQWDEIYLRFDEGLDVTEGDKFSIYTEQGTVTHASSDRKGRRFTIVGSVEILNKVQDLWLARLIETPGIINRGDRLTVYTPPIARITTTFNSRIIESVLLSSYQQHQEHVSFGDLVYLDRGRADGVEMGNVFEVYGFVDRGTGKKIHKNPTYKNGELTVVSLTDDFATAVVTQSRRDFQIGDLAVTKTKEQAVRGDGLALAKTEKKIKDEALEELDIEMSLEDVNDALLDEADRIQFTDEELSELERLEREKSVLSQEEKDLAALERLEKEIENAENKLRESQNDKDKWLEGQSLEKVEETLKYSQQESLDEIEENFGKRYLDETLNEKENPFGLTEYDIEAIDELLNVPESKLQ